MPSPPRPAIAHVAPTGDGFPAGHRFLGRGVDRSVWHTGDGEGRGVSAAADVRATVSIRLARSRRAGSGCRWRGCGAQPLRARGDPGPRWPTGPRASRVRAMRATGAGAFDHRPAMVCPWRERRRRVPPHTTHSPTMQPIIYDPPARNTPLTEPLFCYHARVPCCPASALSVVVALLSLVMFREARVAQRSWSLSAPAPAASSPASFPKNESASAKTSPGRVPWAIRSTCRNDVNDAARALAWWIAQGGVDSRLRDIMNVHSGRTS